MRRSRAGRTGGSWYGSYTIYVNDRPRTDVTSLKHAERSARDYSSAEGEADIRVWDPTDVAWKVIARFVDGRRMKW